MQKIFYLTHSQELNTEEIEVIKKIIKNKKIFKFYENENKNITMPTANTNKQKKKKVKDKPTDNIIWRTLEKTQECGYNVLQDTILYTRTCLFLLSRGARKMDDSM